MVSDPKICMNKPVDMVMENKANDERRASVASHGDVSMP